jgi:hypothetical protein
VWCAETRWRIDNVWRIHVVHVQEVLQTNHHTMRGTYNIKILNYLNSTRIVHRQLARAAAVKKGAGRVVPTPSHTLNRRFSRIRKFAGSPQGYKYTRILQWIWTSNFFHNSNKSWSQLHDVQGSERGEQCLHITMLLQRKLKHYRILKHFLFEGRSIIRGFSLSAVGPET